MAEVGPASEAPSIEMHPAVRAICDRYILEVANVRYLLDLLEDRELDAKPEAGGWTARQMLVHLATSGHMHATFFTNLANGNPPLPDGFDIDPFNDAQAAAATNVDRAKIDAAFGTSRDAALLALAELGKLPGARIEALRPSLEVVSLHYAVHCLDVVRLAPALAGESMIVNWLLHPDFSEHPDRTASQRWLLDEFLRLHPYSEDDDEDDDEDHEDDDDDDD